MAGEGFILQMIQTLRANKALVSSRKKRDMPTAGMYKPVSEMPKHTPEQVAATIAAFKDKQAQHAWKKKATLMITVLATLVIISILVFLFYFFFIADNLMMRNHALDNLSM